MTSARSVISGFMILLRSSALGPLIGIGSRSSQTVVWPGPGPPLGSRVCWRWICCCRCCGGVSRADPVLEVSDWGACCCCCCGVVRARSRSGVLCTSPSFTRLSSSELDAAIEIWNYSNCSMMQFCYLSTVSVIQIYEEMWSFNFCSTAVSSQEETSYPTFYFYWT